MSEAPSRALSRKGLIELAASFGALAALGDVRAAASAPSVVGAWSLVSFNVDEGKTNEAPRFGPDPVGYLLYTSSGKMAAVLSGTHRPALKSPSGAAASEGERSESLVNFLAYAGSYDVKADHVFHHVEVSVFTNLIGTTLERQFSVNGDTLTIRTLPPEIWGGSNVLVWRRA